MDRGDVSEDAEHITVELTPDLIAGVWHDECVEILEAVVRLHDGRCAEPISGLVELPEQCDRLLESGIEQVSELPRRSDHLDVVPSELVNELEQASVALLLQVYHRSAADSVLRDAPSVQLHEQEEHALRCRASDRFAVLGNEQRLDLETRVAVERVAGAGHLEVIDQALHLYFSLSLFFPVTGG